MTKRSRADRRIARRVLAALELRQRRHDQRLTRELLAACDALITARLGEYDVTGRKGSVKGGRGQQV